MIKLYWSDTRTRISKEESPCKLNNCVCVLRVRPPRIAQKLRAQFVNSIKHRPPNMQKFVPGTGEPIFGLEMVHGGGLAIYLFLRRFPQHFS